MSKRIVISESEKNRIKSLYINEGYGMEGEIFQVYVDGDLRSYRVTDIERDKKGEGKFVIYTNQERTDGSGGKLFGGKKQFYFDCTLEGLYGYNGRIMNTEKYSKSDGGSVKFLIEKLCETFCENYSDSPCNKKPLK